jgi:Family of unknown function (DUF6361)
MRELINMFSDHESRDELGIGQVRDAFSDILFPGTSTIHTRARYFLIVPWCAQEGQRKTTRSGGYADRIDRAERTVIKALKQSTDSEFMIGGRAGVAVRTLPSAIYGAALGHYGIRVGDINDRVDDLESEELAERHVGVWHPTLPAPPAGFPGAVDGGLTMTRAEANWLRERVLATAPNTLLAWLLDAEARPEIDSFAPWMDPAAADLPEEIRSQLDHARRFSLAIRGAALLFNLLIREWYEREGFDEVTAPVEAYREDLADWADEVASNRVMAGWARPEMWDLVQDQNPRIAANGRARLFIDRWLDIVATAPTDVADNEKARQLVSERERLVKAAQSRLINRKLLATWSGQSGSRLLVYRWPQARRMVLDIRDGREAAHAGA